MIAKHRAKGFTLIEVLIAMTLLSIMVVLLFASLKICAQSWEQGERKITDVNEVAVVYNFFQQHLPAALPVWNDFAKEKLPALSFQGTSQALQFVSVFPASAGRSGMQLFSIALQQEQGEQLIKVVLAPFFPVTEGEQWHQEEAVLLRHVNRFELSYFGPTPDMGENSWQNQWQDRTGQPLLVKISLGTENGIYWPDMIIALKVASSGNAPATLNAPNNEPAEDRN